MTSQVSKDSDKSAPAGESGTIPADRKLCEEILLVVQNPNLRADDITQRIARDPVLVVQILREANSMKNLSGGAELTSIKSAVISLGTDALSSLAAGLRENSPRLAEDHEHCLNECKDKCRAAASVASTIARYSDKSLRDEAFSSGMFAYLGDILALLKFSDGYIELVENNPRRSSLKYKLSQQHNFDMERETLEYLQRNGVPSLMRNAIDSESKKLSRDGSKLKYIYLSTIEFVEAFLAERWESVGPEKTIPPKSARRMLDISEEAYEQLYQELTGLLVTGQLNQQGYNPLADNVALVDSEEEEEEQEEEKVQVQVQVQVQEQEEEKAQVQEHVQEEERVQEQEKVEMLTPPGESTSDAAVEKNDLASFSEQITSVETLEEIFPHVVQHLVDHGPFERSVIYLISEGQTTAQPLAAWGPDTENLQAHELTDTHSPFLRLNGKTQSFSRKKDSAPPFGTPIYALAPLSIDAAEKVALYADCGEQAAIGFDARRTFREIVADVQRVLSRKS